MRGRPPKKTLTAEQALAADAFVGGAEAPSSGSGRAEAPPDAASARRVSPPVARPEAARRPAPRDARPWEASYVRDDVVKGYALRLPEPLYLKLKWVAAERGQSMNELIAGAVADVVAGHLGEEG